MKIGLLIGILFLITSAVYVVYFIRTIINDREWYDAAPGRLSLVMGIEAVVFFLCTIGVSDFLLNTITCQRLRLTEPRTQPDCNICAALVPSGIIAFMYLRNTEVLDGRLLAVFIVCMVPGSLIGSRALGNMKGDVIRRAMIVFLSVTLVFLVVKTLMTAGSAQSANTLSGWKLAVLGAEAFCAGYINMLGIPAKPMTATTALLLGLSPVATLAITLGALPLACVAGGINIAPRKRYNPKLIVASMTAGSIAGVIGCLAAISINATVLNVIILLVLVSAIISLIKK